MNCTGKNVSKNVLLALGEADANMYLCSKGFRPGKNGFLCLSHGRSLNLVHGGLAGAHGERV